MDGHGGRTSGGTRGPMVRFAPMDAEVVVVGARVRRDGGSSRPARRRASRHGARGPRAHRRAHLVPRDAGRRRVGRVRRHVLLPRAPSPLSPPRSTGTGSPSRRRWNRRRWHGSAVASAATVQTRSRRSGASSPLGPGRGPATPRPRRSPTRDRARARGTGHHGGGVGRGARRRRRGRRLPAFVHGRRWPGPDRAMHRCSRCCGTWWSSTTARSTRSWTWASCSPTARRA